MTHEEMIAVIQAHKEGETILFSDQLKTSDKWMVLDALNLAALKFNFSRFKYRIKPEPRVLYAGYGADGDFIVADPDGVPVLLGGVEDIAKFVEVVE